MQPHDPSFTSMDRIRVWWESTVLADEVARRMRGSAEAPSKYVVRVRLGDRIVQNDPKADPDPATLPTEANVPEEAATAERIRLDASAQGLTVLRLDFRQLHGGRRATRLVVRANDPERFVRDHLAGRPIIATDAGAGDTLILVLDPHDHPLSAAGGLSDAGSVHGKGWLDPAWTPIQFTPFSP